MEEAPLRLVENEHQGSLYHELFSSTTFKEVFKIAPDFKDKIFDLAKNIVGKKKEDLNDTPVETTQQ